MSEEQDLRQSIDSVMCRRSTHSGVRQAWQDAQGTAKIAAALAAGPATALKIRKRTGLSYVRARRLLPRLVGTLLASDVADVRGILRTVYRLQPAPASEPPTASEFSEQPAANGNSEGATADKPAPAEGGKAA